MLPVSISVMHTPDVRERQLFYAQLVKSLGGIAHIRQRVEQFRVSSSPLGELLPGGQRHLWAAAKKAWQNYHPGSSHIVLLQDDMIPVPGFLDALAQIVEARPNHWVTFFSTSTRQAEAVNAGHAWFTLTNMYNGAWMLPIDAIKPMIEWIDRHVHPGYPIDDQRMVLYQRYHGIRAWATAPSIVEHEGAADSLIGNNRRYKEPRLAAALADDASTIDFTRIPETPLHSQWGWPNYRGWLDRHVLDPHERDEWKSRIWA